MQIEEFLGHLPGAPSNGPMHRCPAHDDNNPSLSVSEGDNGRLLLKCHAGCATEDVVQAMGLSMADLFDDDGRNGHVTRAIKSNLELEPIDAAIIEQMHQALTDQTRDYLKQERMLTDATIDRYQLGLDERSGERRISIPIADADGVFRDVRRWLSPLTRTETSPKILHWQSGYGGARLYPFDQLAGPELVLCEGELDALALVSYSIPAITATCGAGSWPEVLSETFRGKAVTVLMDNDETGKKGAQKRADSLARHGATVRVAYWPEDRAESWDITDELHEHGQESLRRILDAAESFEPSNVLSEPAGTGHYRVQDGCIGYMKKVGRGDDATEMFIPLCNFNARVVEDRALDNGLEVTRRFAIELRFSEGRTLPCFEVTAAQFSSMSWVVREAGVKARITAGQGSQDKLREAIQMFSIDVKELYAYAHTGWRKIDGNWQYLHGGRTDVQVALEPPLNRYALPEEPKDVAGALRQSLALLEVAPDMVTFPLLACVYLAPLCEFLHPDFVVFLVGKTGSLKSTLAALFLSHYGQFDRTSLPGSWESTDNALERRLSTLKDTLCVVDDYAPRADAYAQRKQAQRAQRIIRSMGNLSGRSRLKADLSERPEYVPRGLLVSTGEDLPPGQSILARILSVEIEREQLDLAAITQAQKGADPLSHAMAGYIGWLAPQLDELAEVLLEQWRQHRIFFDQNTAHLRIPEILAYLALGMDLFTSYAQDLGVLTEEEAHDLAQRAQRALLELGTAHGQRVREEDPAEVFLSTLSAMLAQGAIALAERNSLVEPEGKVGWKDAEYAYLIPDAAKHAVGRYLRESGGHFPYSARALNEALDGRGALVKGSDGKGTRLVKIRGKNRRVLQVRLSFLEPDDAEGEKGG